MSQTDYGVVRVGMQLCESRGMNDCHFTLDGSVQRETENESVCPVLRCNPKHDFSSTVVLVFDGFLRVLLVAARKVGKTRHEHSVLLL